jgi:RimJ/RimL family protein N-acetyltransferase
MKLKPGQVLEEFEVEGHRIVFRTPGRGDAPRALKHMNRLVAEKAYINMQRRLTLAEERGWLRRAQRTNREGKRNAIVVVMDGEMIGGAGMGPGASGGNLHVGGVGIALSRMRGKGIGTRLMRLLERLARKNRKLKLRRLSVAEKNRPARVLYDKLGYRQVGRIPKGFRYYGKLMDEIIMVKRLRR